MNRQEKGPPPFRGAGLCGQKKDVVLVDQNENLTPRRVDHVPKRELHCPKWS
jgi:hypothetical protein